MWEDEFIFNREKLFKDAKYIIRIESDEASNYKGQKDINVGIVNTIVNRVRQSLIKDYEQTQREIKIIDNKQKKTAE